MMHGDGPCRLPRRATVHYERFLEEADTGDVVLFSGRQMMSRAISVCTDSLWSHVAMVVRLPGMRGPCLWESVRDAGDVECVWSSERGANQTSRRIAPGVRLVDAQRRLESCGVKFVSWRRLVGYDRLTQQAQSTLMRVLMAYEGRPYESSALQMMRSKFRLLLNNRHADLTTFFCSELVAQSFMDMGFMRHMPPSNTYAPCDFGDGGGLPWVQPGLSLEPEVPLLWSKHGRLAALPCHGALIQLLFCGACCWSCCGMDAAGITAEDGAPPTWPSACAAASHSPISSSLSAHERHRRGAPTAMTMPLSLAGMVLDPAELGDPNFRFFSSFD